MIHDTEVRNQRATIVADVMALEAGVTDAFVCHGLQLG